MKDEPELAGGDCVAHIEHALRKHAMLDVSERTLVAVSGGPDSVCLLHILHGLGYPLEVAHFDHQTRQGESGLDAAFVRDLAGTLSLPFHLESRSIEAEARDAGVSFEEHARAARYDFFARTAAGRECVAVATGHHADDQVETMLMRLLRGTTPHGLAGIPPVRQYAGVRIVRPLIECTRAGILAYLDAHQIAYRTDGSNAEGRFLRNRIRHELLPQLVREYNPALGAALIRLGEAQRLDNEFLDAQARSAREVCFTEDTGIDRHVFAGLEPAIRNRLVVMLAWRYGIDCPFDRVVAAADFIASGPTGNRFDLGLGVLLCNGRAVTDVVSAAQTLDDRVAPLAVPGVTEAFGRVFSIVCRDEAPSDDLARYCHAARQVFDADAFGAEVSVRHRRPGDRFMPFGMSGTRKIQDYFVDIGLPASQRDAQLLLVAGGRIAWIVGHAISAHAAVTSQTRRFVEIEVRRAHP